MSWGSLDNFFAMGGHAFYVWGSYVVTAVLIIAEVYLLKARIRSAHTAITRNGPAA